MSHPGSRKERFNCFKLRSLVEEIKDILNKYPDDGQIFKELIQNAEDAGATEIVFVYDQNTYTSTGKRFSVDGIKKLQGPCLYAYNNGYFDDNDWDGIRSLAISNKRTDPLKVGRFGLGFKSVFHLTDVPSISSGSSMAYLNPLKDIFGKEMEFLEFEEERADAEKLCQFSDFACYKKIPAKFSINSNGYCNGTVFRFPLRQIESQISTSLYTHQRMENLIETFMAEGNMNLLFLKNIKQIKFLIINKNGSSKEIYQVRLDENCNQMYGEPRRQFIKKIREQTEKRSFTPLNLNHCIDLLERKDGKESKHSFVLSEVYGYSDTDQFRKLIEDPELSYVPLVGVAFPLNGGKGGHVYCGLPLPLTERRMTGLPVHVNGYFSVSDDRRDLKWKTISSRISNDKSAIWNGYLIEKLLPDAYCNLMKFLLHLSKDHIVFYSAWPCQDMVNEKWSSFLNKLYQLMLSLKCVFITSKGFWNNVQTTVFLIKNEFQLNDVYLAVKKFLESTPCLTASVPAHVFKSLPNPATVNGEYILRFLQSYPNCFKSLRKEEQIDLLSYGVKTARDVNRLSGLDVLPMMNGNYGVLKQSQDNLIYIPTRDHPADVFPTDDNVLDISLLSRAHSLLKVLQEASLNESTNLCLLDHWEKVLIAVQGKVVASKEVPFTDVFFTHRFGDKDKKPADNKFILNQFKKKNWLQRFWSYRQQKRIPINRLDGMHLIPVTVSGQKYLHEVRTNSLLMLTSHGNEHISNPMKELLEKCGLKFVDSNALDFQVWYDLLSNQKILFPDSTGIIAALDYAARRSGVGYVTSMCANESDSVRSEIVTAATISRYLTLPDIIMKLPVFKVFNGRNFTCIEEAVLADKRNIPPIWRSEFANILESECLSYDLLKKVKQLKRWNFEDIIQFLFTGKFGLSITDTDELSLFVLKFITKNEVTNGFLSLLKQHLVVKSGSIRSKPSALFQSSQEMQILFYGENGKFPDDSYNRYDEGLIKLGLKKRKADISSSDLANSIYFMQNIKSSTLIGMELRRKVQAILEISNKQQLDISQFNQLDWIPITQEKPYDYPRSLHWAGSNQFGLHSPNNIFAKKYTKVAGSTIKIVHDDVSQLFHKVFGSQHPPLVMVCRHLQTIVASFKEGESLAYKEMIENIYSYLSECNFSQVAENLRKTVRKVWYGNRFIDFDRVLTNQTSISVEPYYYCLSDAVPNSFHQFVKELGNGLPETNIYIDVLQKLFQNYQNENIKFSSDLELSIEVIKHLAENFTGIPEDLKSLIYVPVASRFIKYCKLKDCFYHSSGGPNFSSAAEHNILHPSLSKDIARKLGIPNLISQVLSGDDFFEPWGQGEPLVLRLNRLLKDYEDGLAIPKELIQNADDAGATEVSFLYDERENNDLKATLFHPDMKEWQGPAFWVFNDGQFTEDDFKNITRLNAGTKNEDLTKIGKFGLGFNAVYHLTDVPSFISGQSMIIFDPHSVYLGDALKDKANPGVRVNFLNSSKDYKHFSHQFKVFHGVFGAKLDFDEGVVDAFPGTLFRLPLRNSSTADRSEISNLVYDSKEMHELLSKLRASLNHLLLFTQNVKSVKCFHLRKTARLVTEKTLMFSVCKETDNSMQRNVVKEAASVLQQVKMNWQRIPSEKVVETVQVTVKDQDEEKKSSWLISSCIGSDSSFEFAKSRSGFNPCGGVALRYEMSVDGRILLPDDEKNQCFMFCFLPLPENSHLPVHVNGAFEVSNDRKHLVQHTSDEKKYGEVSEWNSLLGGDIGEAYYNMLLWLKSKNVDVSLKSWLKVMPSRPLPIQNECIMALCKSLMVKLLSRGDNLFPYLVSGGLSWTSWNLIILTNKLPPKLRKLARKFINWCEKLRGSRKVCLDMSDDFIHLLKDLGCSDFLASSFISPSMFYQMVFKYIGESTLDRSLRISILKTFIIMQSLDMELDTLLSSVPCIPTEPNGALKLPSELIQADSRVSILYDVSDEVFPLKEFGCLHFELEKLGMNVHSLPWSMILYRAQSIADTAQSFNSNSNVIAFKRSDFLVQLMTDHLIPCPTHVYNELVQTSFLPVLQRSGDATLPWYGNEKNFGAPQEMYLRIYEDVVSCVGLVCRVSYKSKLSAFLGIDRIPSFEMVKSHLRCVIDSYDGMNCKIDDRLIKNLTAVYFHLSRYSMDENLESLSKLKMLYTENGRLVEPTTVCMDVDQEISGYLHKLPLVLHSYKELMLRLRVKTGCYVTDYLNILRDINTDYESQPLPKHILNSILHHIIPHLYNKIEDIKKYNQDQHIYLPDHHGCMRNLKDLCYRNATWLPEEEGILYAHKEIPNPYCERLGMKSLGNQFLGKNSSGIPFGQHEELCTRIKNLLKGYANTDDVLKEILQNADDAGASEVDFILDLRNHGDEKVFCDNWKPLQGPALIVCNNGKFTKSDLEAIQSLGVGNKSTNPLKTGKYGVGFNAVYHLTDCPSLLTDIDGIEDVLCIFDPNLNFIDGATKEYPGRMFENARKLLLDVYTDLKSAYLLDEYDSTKKTMFRFPLRSVEMMSSSKLSDTVVRVKDMKEKLKILKKESLTSLLFLKNVNHLTFHIISEDGVSSGKTVFRAKPYDVKSKDLKDFKVFEKNFLERHGNLSSIMKYVKQLNRHVCLQHLEGERLVKSYHLQVVEQCGFSDMDQLPPDLLSMIERNELCLTPRGAVASQINDSCCERCEELPRHDREKEKGNGDKYFSNSNLVFCTLPILEKSNLPVIINGHFVLNYETRRCLYSNHQNCEERNWNVLILNNCILPCYINLLLDKAQELKGCYEEEEQEKEKKERELTCYYKWFPIVKDSSDENNYWEIMKKAFYNLIHKSNHPILPVHKVNDKEIMFCKPKDDFLLFDVGVGKMPLLKVLQSAHIPTDALPIDISSSFEKCDAKLTSVSPTAIREHLCKNYKAILPQNNKSRNVKDTVFKNVKNVVMVLQYCLEEEKTSIEKRSTEKISTEVQKISLQNLPLCLLADETLNVFSFEKKVFFTKHSTLIKGEERMFLHQKAFNLFKSEKYWMDYDCFQKFTLDNFNNLLPKVLPPDIFKDANGPIPFAHKNVDITKKWLTDVWKYIESQEEKLLLDSISAWSLVLCKQKKKEFLVPINQSKSIVNLFSGSYRRLSPELFNALENDFCILQASYIKPKKPEKGEDQSTTKKEVFIYNEETGKDIFGDFSNVCDFVNAIWYSYKQNLFQDVTIESAGEVLKSLLGDFNEDVGIEVTEKLKDLPLFERYDGKLSPAHSFMVVLPLNAHVKGLDTIEPSDHCYLAHREKFIPIYKALGFQICDVHSFYENHIFPAFPQFSDDVVVSHMEWICRNRVWLNLEVSRLKDIEFIRCSETRKRAAQLYDPNNEIFKLMLSPSDFPPEKFLDEFWYEFLKEIGLNTELDETLFIRFAKEIETELDDEKALQVSQHLCRLLSPSSYNTVFKSQSFLSQIKKIKFIIPEEMPDFLERIHVSKNADLIRTGHNKRIHFEGSASKEQKKLCWTTLFILPDYAYVGYSNELGVQSDVEKTKKNKNCLLSVDAVLQHMRNITSSELMESEIVGCAIPKAVRETFWEVMETIYSFLMERVDLQELETSCRDINMILVSNGEKLCVPSKTVFSQEYAVPNYLNVVWERQGRYFEMFEQIGCAREPNAKHYQKVLEDIFQKTGPKVKDPNERKAAKRATFLLSCVLPQSHDQLTNELSLYLPTVTFQINDVLLTLSSDAIHVDDHHLEGRLQNFTKRILVAKYHRQEDKVNEILIQYLPDPMKPKRLSDVVKEELDGSATNTVSVGSDHVSERVKAKFHSQKFRNAIERLIRHEQKIRQTVDDVSKHLKVVTDALAHVQVFVLAEVKTHLTYENRTIEGSQVSNSCYLKFRNNGLSIYFSLDAEATSLVFTSVATGMLEIFRNVLCHKKTMMQLPILLEHPDDKLSSILDDAAIFDENADTYLDYAKDPVPGDLVPMELHGILSNDVKNFKEDEYVAMEIGEDDVKQYIFVIIRKVGNQPDPYQREYGVQITEDVNDITFTKAYNLYKFLSLHSTEKTEDDTSLVLSKEADDFVDEEGEIFFEEEEDRRTFEEITKEIREILRNTSGEDRKKIARRLYLRWHPDKNPEEKKELSTKVFQFIQNELEKLNEGFQQKFSYWDTTAQWQSRCHRSYQSNFRENRRRHYSGHSGSRKRASSGGGFHGNFSSFVPPTFDTKNPQPAEAKRWFKQATFDLIVMEDIKSFEWVCFTAHQAAQKALKAARYLQHYERITTTNLITLSASLSADLQNLSRELETLVKSSEHMLNPELWRRPNVPHTEYTENMAARAMEVAKRIVEIVEEKM